MTSPTPGPESVGRILINHLVDLTSISNEVEFFFVTDKIYSNNFKGKIFSYLNSVIPLPEVPILSFEWENFLSSKTLKNLCNVLKPDLVHIHGRAGYYPAPPKGYPSLVTFHEFPPMTVYDDFSFGPSKILLNSWLKRGKMIRMKRIPDYDHFHALSSEIALFLKASGIANSKIHLIPNGTLKTPRSVNKEYFKKKFKRILGLSDNSKILTMVGTISYHKGIHFIKRCIPELPTNYHLVLVGSSTKFIGHQYLRAILKGKHSHRIHYVGYQSPNVIYSILNASDCFLSLSISEACQLSLLEAVSTGIPVIITECGAAKDIFGSDYYFLLPTYPNIKLLRDKIVEIVENGSKFQNIKINIKSWKDVAIMMKKLYFSIKTEEFIE